MKKNKKTGLYEFKYWHPAVTTDAVVFGFDGKDLNILLIKRGNEPFKGMWALPGGFMIELDHNAKDCMKREISEQLNVRDIPLKQIGVFSEIDRDPRERVITIAFTALIRKEDYEIQAGIDAENVGWFKINELPELAFDHRDIVDKAMEELWKSLLLGPVCFVLLNEEFTLTELQNIFIAILDPQRSNKKLGDRRSFKKKMDSLGYIEQIEGVTKKEKGYKPSNLYRFNLEAYLEARSQWIRIVSDFM